MILAIGDCGPATASATGLPDTGGRCIGASGQPVRGGISKPRQRPVGTRVSSPPRNFPPASEKSRDAAAARSYRSHACRANGPTGPSIATARLVLRIRVVFRLLTTTAVMAVLGGFVAARNSRSVQRPCGSIPPSAYSRSAPDDPVALLNARLQKGEVTLEHDSRSGYLSAGPERAEGAGELAGAGVLEDQFSGGAHQSQESTRLVFQRHRVGRLGPRRRRAGIRRAGPASGNDLLHARSGDSRPAPVRAQCRLCSVPHVGGHTGRAGDVRRQRVSGPERHGAVLLALQH